MGAFLKEYLVQNALFKKGILNNGILSRDIGGHFLKGKRAFPPNRQKPTWLSSSLPTVSSGAASEDSFSVEHVDGGQQKRMSCILYTPAKTNEVKLGDSPSPIPPQTPTSSSTPVFL